MDTEPSFLRGLYLKSRAVVGVEPLPEERLGILGPDPADTQDLLKSPQDGEPKPINLLHKYFSRGPYGDRFQIRDQGRTNRCGGFAGRAGALLMTRKLEVLSGKDKPWQGDYSSNEIYWNARLDPTRDSGVYMRDLMKSLHKDGVCSAAYWQDHENLFRRPSEIEGASRYFIPGYERLSTGHKASAAEFVQVLSVEELPIFIGATMFKYVSDNALKHRGLFQMPKSNDPTIGGHAMLIVGWLSSGGKKVFILVNSWGHKVGDRGIFYMPEDYVSERLVTDAWTLPANTF